MSNVVVYDKAKWHYEGDFPGDVDRAHAYTHGGYFFGWAVENDLADDDFVADFDDDIRRFLNKKVTARDLYQSVDGRLVSDMLNDVGNAFSAAYFDRYLDDYESILCAEPDSWYYIADTPENYARVCTWLTERFDEWKASQ